MKSTREYVNKRKREERKKKNRNEREYPRDIYQRPSNSSKRDEKAPTDYNKSYTMSRVKACREKKRVR